MKQLSFVSDYMEGAHPKIMERLMETNLLQTEGYGFDAFSESAREKIRKACKAYEADIFFLAGGTQTNAVLIGAVLSSYQGVIAASSGHINGHEAGAIELSGHKVLTIPPHEGKLDAEDIRCFLKNYEEDENRDHIVMPGMVYLSQPTECGTLYSLEELRSIRKVCDEYKIPLYLDGARLAYALACPENDVSLSDIAALCDAFYIGGTKCGALFGEALVIPKHNFIPHLFTILKQHGAVFAKGRINGIQFDTFFTDDLYYRIGKNAIDAADRIRTTLIEKGYDLAFPSPTNQIFPLLDEEQQKRLSEFVDMEFWEKTDDGRTVFRLATSWATTEEAVSRLLELL